jgi:hypothetical protein
MLHESVPVQSWNVLFFEDMQNGQVYEIAGDGTPFETSSEDVTKYMSARFDTTSTYCFNRIYRYGDGLPTRSVRRLMPKWGHGLQRVGDEMGLVPIQAS